MQPGLPSEKGSDNKQTLQQDTEKTRTVRQGFVTRGDGTELAPLERYLEAEIKPVLGPGLDTQCRG